MVNKSVFKQKILQFHKTLLNAQVWHMNETDARNLIKQILNCDKILHEQQLGMEWTAPKEDAGGDNFADAMSEAGTQTGKSKAMSSQHTGESGGGTGTGKYGSGGAVGRYPPTKVKKMLDLIKEEAAYLIDNKARDEIAAAPDDAQRQVMQVNAILRYIGVESQEDIDLLVSLFCMTDTINGSLPSLFMSWRVLLGFLISSFSV